jgi:hypothetical protein
MCKSMVGTAVAMEGGTGAGAPRLCSSVHAEVRRRWRVHRDHARASPVRTSSDCQKAVLRRDTLGGEYVALGPALGGVGSRVQ